MTTLYQSGLLKGYEVQYTFRAHEQPMIKDDSVRARNLTPAVGIAGIPCYLLRIIMSLDPFHECGHQAQQITGKRWTRPSMGARGEPENAKPQATQTPCRPL